MANKQKIKLPGPAATPAATKGLSATVKLAVLLGLISFVVYANTLRNGFVLDDSVMITNNHLVSKGITSVPELLATPHQWGFWQNPNDEYRPLSLVMFSAVYDAFATNPVPYHLMNILLFAGCVVLLFRFLDKLFEGRKTVVAFLASLLFALHPVHTEVVANVKSADELLCFFFAFLSLNVFIAYLETGIMVRLLLGALCLLLSFLAKETAITLLFIIPLVFFFYRNEEKKRSVHIMLATVGVTAIFLVIRYAVLSHYHVNSVSSISFIENMLAKKGLPLESRLATAIIILGYYLRLLVLPYPLISDYSCNTIPFTHFSDPWVLLSLAAYIGLAVLAVLRMVKNKKDPYAFAILFFLITIALFSNVLFLIKATAGERFLFFPVAGFCLVVALLFGRLSGTAPADFSLLKRPLVAAILFPLCLIYAALSISRNADWLDNYTLYSADLKTAPGNARLNYFMGDLLLTNSNATGDPTVRIQDKKDAIACYQKAIAAHPGYYLAQADIGAAFFDLSMYDSAIVHDMAAIQIDPKAALPANNLSWLYAEIKKYDKSVEVGKAAIAVNPGNKVAYANVSFSYLSLNQLDSAVSYSKRGLAIDPDFNGFYQILATTYNTMGNKDSAQKYEAIARKYNPAFRLN